jgi:hypothetical protein
MGNGEPVYRWESDDGRFSAWYVESWYYGRHYRFYSYSPWDAGDVNGTRCVDEGDARKSVDEYREKWLSEGR